MFKKKKKEEPVVKPEEKETFEETIYVSYKARDMFYYYKQPIISSSKEDALCGCGPTKVAIYKLTGFTTVVKECQIKEVPETE